MRFLAWVGLVGVTLVATSLGCANRPVGPAFSKAADPAPHRARIYVYRADDRVSLSTIRVQIAGRQLGPLHDREYETVELPAGPKTLRAGLRSFAWNSWGWNQHEINLEPGETVFLKLSVRLNGSALPSTRELQIAGRTSGTASENVFIQRMPASEAEQEITITTRSVRAGP